MRGEDQIGPIEEISVIVVFGGGKFREKIFDSHGMRSKI